VLGHASRSLVRPARCRPRQDARGRHRRAALQALPPPSAWPGQAGARRPRIHRTPPQDQTAAAPQQAAPPHPTGTARPL